MIVYRELSQRCLIVFLALAATSQASIAEEGNWPRWRGPERNGSAAEGDYPVKWDPETVLWKTDVPGKGRSTPIVWNKRIYLTAGADGSDTVFAFDWSGKQVWQRQLGSHGKERNPQSSSSNPSVATDGSALFVIFKSGNLAALELDGSIRWKTNLFERYGEDNRFFDFAASPVLTSKDVVITELHDGESWVAAFDKFTGEVRWKVARNYETPQEGSHGYSTPLVFSHNGTEALIVWGGRHLTAYGAADGNMIWSCGGFNPEGEDLWPAIGSPVISGEVVVVPYGRTLRRKPRLHGIRLGGSGDITDTHRLWKREDTGPFVPSPAEYEGRVYTVRDGGEVDRIDPKTGESVWTGELPGKGNLRFYASPLIAGGHLYAARVDGTIFVVGIEGEFEIVSEIKMNDEIVASPIAVSGRLLIRTTHHLFCIESD
ncbi:MAG: PQQ-binding-like beta-propeller repeat protein [Candidatus Hydrogenedentes bacterium]|nr:PQQ-binding-like beta-propeller repeat protein [Candidatus Hydrogenedentota bacterium]